MTIAISDHKQVNKTAEGHIAAFVGTTKSERKALLDKTTSKANKGFSKRSEDESPVNEPLAGSEPSGGNGFYPRPGIAFYAMEAMLLEVDSDNALEQSWIAQSSKFIQNLRAEWKTFAQKSYEELTNQAKQMNTQAIGAGIQAGLGFASAVAGGFIQIRGESAIKGMESDLQSANLKLTDGSVEVVAKGQKSPVEAWGKGPQGPVNMAEDGSFEMSDLKPQPKITAQTATTEEGLEGTQSGSSSEEVETNNVSNERAQKLADEQRIEDRDAIKREIDTKQKSMQNYGQMAYAANGVGQGAGQLISTAGVAPLKVEEAGINKAKNEAQANKDIDSMYANTTEDIFNKLYSRIQAVFSEAGQVAAGAARAVRG